MRLLTSCLLVMVTLAIVNGDVYLHNPRGSNNRLDARGRNRRNANRLFDSQNNARGGYNVGEKNLDKDKWRFYYLSGSELVIEWANQHSCAGLNNNCEMIIQYMCRENIRDGTDEATIPDQKRSIDMERYGMQEDYSYYQDCKYTQRNKGLYLADQKLRGKSAKYTRQNRKGRRYGFECPEEKDYYPYWRPSPWKDIVIMTNDVERCDYYKAESQNVKPRYACVLPEDIRKKLKKDKKNRRKVIPITKEDCENFKVYDKDANGKKVLIDAQGTWTKFSAHNISAPECIKSKWSRDNHNGNGKGGFTNRYIWNVPDIDEKNCILRIRYNISTNDYDGWNTTANTEKGGDNVAYRKNATQSSTSWKWDASRAVDGNRNSRWWTTCTRTRRERNAWWRVDLGESLPVRVVNIVSGRGTLRNFKISVGDVDDPNTNPLCYYEEDSLKRFKVESYKCTNESLSGRYVYVTLNSNRKDVLRLCEVEVISNPIPSVNDLLAQRMGLTAENAEDRGYLFEGNPEIQVLANYSKLNLRLAINTAQFGRTFQDRSHTFDIKKRPDSLKGAKIYNLNVRGKRGNAQQVYPAVEYDFVPNRLYMYLNDYVHIQWTGADTNPRNNAGQGPRGQDSSNVVLLAAQVYPEGTPGSICPKKYGHWGRNYPENVTVANFLGFSLDDKIKLAYALYKPYFDLGPRKATSTGTFFYFSSHNNAFTNRSQKGKIVVKDPNAPCEDVIVTSKRSSIHKAKIQADLPDNEEGVSLAEDTMSIKPIKVIEWSRKEAEDYIKSKGGKMDQGDEYASNFLVVSPMEDLTKDDTKFEVNLKTDVGIKSKRTIYHSIDTKNWHEVSDVYIDEETGMASFDASKGGLYVARINKNEKKKDTEEKSLKEKLKSMVA